MEIPEAYSRDTADHWRHQYEGFLLQDNEREGQTPTERRDAHRLVDAIFSVAKNPNKSGVKILLDKMAVNTQAPPTYAEIAALCAIYMKNHVKMDSMRGHYTHLSNALNAARGEMVSPECLKDLEWIVCEQLDYRTICNPLDDVIGGLLYGLFEKERRDDLEYKAWRHQMLNIAMPMAELVLGRKSATAYSMMRNCVGSLLWAFAFSGQIHIQASSWFGRASEEEWRTFDDDVSKLIFKVFHREEQPDISNFVLHSKEDPGYLGAFDRLQTLTSFDMREMKKSFFEVVRFASIQVDIEEAELLCMYSPSEVSTHAPPSCSSACSISSDESINCRSSSP